MRGISPYTYYGLLLYDDYHYHRAWNSLPSDVKKADTVKTFKKRLDFTVLQTILISLNRFVWLEVNY